MHLLGRTYRDSVIFHAFHSHDLFTHAKLYFTKYWWHINDNNKDNNLFSVFYILCFCLGCTLCEINYIYNNNNKDLN